MVACFVDILGGENLECKSLHLLRIEDEILGNSRGLAEADLVEGSV